MPEQGIADGDQYIVVHDKKKWPWRTLLAVAFLVALLITAICLWWHFRDEDETPAATPIAVVETQTPQPTARPLPTVTTTPIEVTPGVFMLPRRYAEQGILRAPHWPATDSKGGDA